MLTLLKFCEMHRLSIAFVYSLIRVSIVWKSYFDTAVEVEIFNRILTSGILVTGMNNLN